MAHIAFQPRPIIKDHHLPGLRPGRPLQLLAPIGMTALGKIDPIPIHDPRQFTIILVPAAARFVHRVEYVGEIPDDEKMI